MSDYGIGFREPQTGDIRLNASYASYPHSANRAYDRRAHGAPLSPNLSPTSQGGYHRREASRASTTGTWISASRFVRPTPGHIPNPDPIPLPQQAYMGRPYSEDRYHHEGVRRAPALEEEPPEEYMAMPLGRDPEYESGDGFDEPEPERGFVGGFFNKIKRLPQAFKKPMRLFRQQQQPTPPVTPQPQHPQLMQTEPLHVQRRLPRRQMTDETMQTAGSQPPLYSVHPPTPPPEEPEEHEEHHYPPMHADNNGGGERNVTYVDMNSTIGAQSLVNTPRGPQHTLTGEPAPQLPGALPEDAEVEQLDAGMPEHPEAGSHHSDLQDSPLSQHPSQRSAHSQRSQPRSQGHGQDPQQLEPLQPPDPAHIQEEDGHHASPILASPQPGPDYAKMPGYTSESDGRSSFFHTAPSELSSFGSYLDRITQFVHDLVDLPWSSVRITADYVPTENTRGRYKRYRQRHQPIGMAGASAALGDDSWYARVRGRQDVDLLEGGGAGGSPVVNMGLGMQQHQQQQPQQPQQQAYNGFGHYYGPGYVPSPPQDQQQMSPVSAVYPQHDMSQGQGPGLYGPRTPPQGYYHQRPTSGAYRWPQRSPTIRPSSPRMGGGGYPQHDGHVPQRTYSPWRNSRAIAVRAHGAGAGGGGGGSEAGSSPRGSRRVSWYNQGGRPLSQFSQGDTQQQQQLQQQQYQYQQQQQRTNLHAIITEEREGGGEQ